MPQKKIDLTITITLVELKLRTSKFKSTKITTTTIFADSSAARR